MICDVIGSDEKDTVSEQMTPNNGPQKSTDELSAKNSSQSVIINSS
jgi:hypothetical protein